MGVGASRLGAFGLDSTSRALAGLASSLEEDAAKLTSDVFSRPLLLHAAASYALLAGNLPRAEALARSALGSTRLGDGTHEELCELLERVQVLSRR